MSDVSEDLSLRRSTRIRGGDARNGVDNGVETSPNPTITTEALSASVRVFDPVSVSSAGANVVAVDLSVRPAEAIGVSRDGVNVASVHVSSSVGNGAPVSGVLPPEPLSVSSGSDPVRPHVPVEPVAGVSEEARRFLQERFPLGPAGHEPARPSQSSSESSDQALLAALARLPPSERDRLLYSANSGRIPPPVGSSVPNWGSDPYGGARGVGLPSPYRSCNVFTNNPTLEAYVKTSTLTAADVGALPTATPSCIEFRNWRDRLDQRTKNQDRLYFATRPPLEAKARLEQLCSSKLEALPQGERQQLETALLGAQSELFNVILGCLHSSLVEPLKAEARSEPSNNLPVTLGLTTVSDRYGSGTSWHENAHWLLNRLEQRFGRLRSVGVVPSVMSVFRVKFDETMDPAGVMAEFKNRQALVKSYLKLKHNFFAEEQTEAMVFMSFIPRIAMYAKTIEELDLREPHEVTMDMISHYLRIDFNLKKNTTLVQSSPAKAPSEKRSAPAASHEEQLAPARNGDESKRGRGGGAYRGNSSRGDRGSFRGGRGDFRGGRGGSYGRSNLQCYHCGDFGHLQSSCFKRFPHLRPQNNNDDSETPLTEPRPFSGFMSESVQASSETASSTVKEEKSERNDEFACASLAVTYGESHRDAIMFDSGASSHVTGRRELLQDIKAISPPITLNGLTGSTNKCVEEGTLVIDNGITLTNVRYLPGFPFTLLALPRVCARQPGGMRDNPFAIIAYMGKMRIIDIRSLGFDRTVLDWFNSHEVAKKQLTAEIDEVTGVFVCRTLLKRVQAVPPSGLRATTPAERRSLKDHLQQVEKATKDVDDSTKRLKEATDAAEAAQQETMKRARLLHGDLTAAQERALQAANPPPSRSQRIPRLQNVPGKQRLQQEAPHERS